MTVYVDNIRRNFFGRMVFCHMVADTESELHAMAAAIGVARRWYQGDHYDICLKMRARAVAHGAVEITMREAVNYRRRLRLNAMLPDARKAYAKCRAAEEKLRRIRVRFDPMDAIEVGPHANVGSSK